MKYIILLMILTSFLLAQKENVRITHPVYSLIIRYEAKGYLPNFSTSDIPLSREEIIKALYLINEQKNNLSTLEKKSLGKYLKEFELTERDESVLFYSSSSKSQVLSSKFISNDEKMIYYYNDDKHNLSIYPLANLDNYSKITENDSEYFSIGNLGFRMHGTLDNMFGYNLQVTNGVLISGDRDLAVEDPLYSKNVKFSLLESDIDFTDSHLRFEYDWFFAGIGREQRNLGSGLNQKAFFSTNSPAFDALEIGADLKYFNYKFMHGSLIGISDSGVADWGFVGEIDPKYIAMHRFSVTPEWGEIAFWESIIYSRPIELAYLNPLSFFKSLEHALRDRDNSLMGMDFTFRPFDNFQLKSTFLLDDIKFKEVGKSYWGNKSAFNIAVSYILPYGLDFNFEYARVEPFTYTHFNVNNSYTNSKRMLGSYLLPNSDRFNFVLNWWFGSRYPLTLDIKYTQHGDNVYDNNGNLIKNVGGDPLLTHTAGTSNYVRFLSGNMEYIFDSSISFGFEFFRGLNLRSIIGLRTINGEPENYFRVIIGVYEL